MEPERERGYLVDAANGCGAKRWWLSRVAANLGSEGATVIAGSGLFTNPFVYMYTFGSAQEVVELHNSP
jgi:hypothetical protein